MEKYLTEHKKIRYLFLCVSAALTALTLIFPSIGFLEWISLIPCALVFIIAAMDKNIKYKKMYMYGFVYFMSFFVVNFHWFANMYPFSFIDGITKFDAVIIVIVSWFGLSLLQTVFAAFMPVILALVVRQKLCEKHRMFVPFLAAALFTVFEWLQTLTWAGVPWGRLSIGQTSSPVMIKSASLLGSYLITFLLVSVNFLLAEFILCGREKKKNIYIMLSVALIAFNATAGGICLICDRDKGESYKAAAVQPNIPSGEKWGSDSLKITKERMTKYSEKAVKEGAKLIIFPETVFPYHPLENSSIKNFIQELAKNCKATIAIGGFTVGEELDENSLIFVNPDGSINEQVYSKRHLVPFGEYVPLRKFVSKVVPQLTEIAMLSEDLAPGKDSNIVDTEVGKIGSIICFDSIYEMLTVDSARDGAQILVMATNDSWFLDSAGVYMHNCQAKLRAVETGRYVVRSANTGISSIINPDGEILDFEEPMVEGYVIADVFNRDSVTLYTRIGNTFVYLLITFCVAFILIKIISVAKATKSKNESNKAT